MIATPEPIGVPLWTDEHGKVRISRFQQTRAIQ